MVDCQKMSLYNSFPIWPEDLKENMPIPTHAYFKTFIVPLEDCQDYSDIERLGPHQTSTVCLKPSEAPLYQVHMPHGTKYAIGILNLWNGKIVAKITIGSQLIGHFIIHPKKAEVLFRPIHSDIGFVFISQDSQIGHQVSQIQGSGSKNSLIDIEIWPEDLLSTEDGFETKYFTLNSLKGFSSQASNSHIQKKWTNNTITKDKYGVACANDIPSSISPKRGLSIVTDTTPPSKSLKVAAAAAAAPASASAWESLPRSGLSCETDGAGVSNVSNFGHTVLSGQTNKKYIVGAPIKTRGVLYYRLNLRVGSLETNNPNVSYLFNNNFVSYAPYCFNCISGSNVNCVCPTIAMTNV